MNPGALRLSPVEPLPNTLFLKTSFVCYLLLFFKKLFYLLKYSLYNIMLVSDVLHNDLTFAYIVK